MESARVLVIGGGLAGLTTAREILQRRPDARVLVLESHDEAGGNVRTLRRDGCTVELGPDAFHTQPGHAQALCASLGLGDTLRTPDEGASQVMVARGDGMLPMPEGMAYGMPRSVKQLAGTRLLSPIGKARAALDLLLPDSDSQEQSVGALVGRRFGHEVKEHLVEPIVGDIYGGDVDELDAAVVMPMFANVRGSLLRALAKAPRASGASPMRAPGGGLRDLVDALVRDIGEERVLRGAPVRSLSRRGDGWSVGLDEGVRLDADDVVLATPPTVTAQLVGQVSTDTADTLRGFKLRMALTVVLAFARARVRAPAASGVVIPRSAAAPLDVLSAVSFVDRKWPERVPAHLTVLRATFRVSAAAEWMQRDDATIVERALEALRAILPLPAPRWFDVERFATGTPCPEVGHRRRVEAGRARVRSLGRAWAVGAAWDGPGIAGCVGGATEAAAAITGRWS